jgi:hypothetical protein
VFSATFGALSVDTGKHSALNKQPAKDAHPQSRQADAIATLKIVQLFAQKSRERSLFR